MKHPRTLIRQAVKDRLVAQLPLVDPRISEARISIHRSTPLFAAKLPAILIYTRDERIEDAPSSHPGIRYRKLELSVEVITSGEAAIEDADTLAQAIETILDADETLGLLVQGTRLTRTEVDHDGDGDTPVLAARMTFEVSYWTKPMEVPDGLLPLQVLVCTAPQIGLLHEGAYQPVDTRDLTPAGTP